MKFMNVNCFKTEALQIYVEILTVSQKECDVFPERTLDEPNSYWICFVFSFRKDVNIYVLFDSNYSKKFVFMWN